MATHGCRHPDGERPSSPQLPEGSASPGSSLIHTTKQVTSKSKMRACGHSPSTTFRAGNCQPSTNINCLIRKGAEASIPLFFFFLKYSWFVLICDHFCHTAKWLSYTSLHILCHIFSIMVYHRILNRVPSAYNRTLLFIHSTYNSLSFMNTALVMVKGLA